MIEQLKKIEKRYEELELLLGSPEVLSDKSLCNRYAKELSDLKDAVSLYREQKKIESEINGLLHLLQEKHEPGFVELAKSELLDLRSRLAQIERKIKDELTVEDKDANKDIIVEIRQGTGGLEAALFAADLYRMYSKYAAQKGWLVEAMTSHPTEVGGFKEVVFSVQGKGAYPHLKFESGVHRVQRVPTTEAQGRIHTSTATVTVLIEAEEVDLVIEQKDLKLDTYRASGAGGQSVQKTESAVRITHLPSGLVVTCQDERSQLKNKSKAMRILRTRLLDLKKQEEVKKITEERRSQMGSGDRSEKIRTYNFPDRRVTDHRINFTVHRLEAILEGDLDELFDALLKASQEKTKEVLR